MLKKAGWDVSHEWKVVLLLSLGFGLVGLDRFLIMPLFPVMQEDLGLSYQDLGIITGALAVAWGISALFMGSMADKVGRKKVLIYSLILFSLLAGFSGLAVGLVQLVIIRVFIGFSEGAFTPPAIAETLSVSKPTRHGLNLGIQQAALPLFGLALAPIISTQLLQVVDWRWVFALVVIPGFIVAGLLYLVLRNGIERGGQTQSDQYAHVQSSLRPQDRSWRDVFGYRNVPLNMLGMLCWLTCLIVISAMMPSYLVDHHNFTLQEMGIVLSALGFGASIGTVTLPWLSDYIGRKPVMVLSVIGQIVGLIWMIQTGPVVGHLFALLFAVAFFNMAAICLTVGPLSAESVPEDLTSTASGMAVGVGEIFGGGVAPIIAGFVAHAYGIKYVPHLAVVALSIGFFVTLALKETRPKA